jgi:hypothetical protein
LRCEARADEQEDAGKDERDERSSKAYAQRRMVGDLADDLGREGVAEEVNAEEIHRDSRGADGRGYRVHNRRVERAGVEKEKELRSEERGDGEAAGTEEEKNAEGQRERDAPEAQEVERAVVGAEPALRDPAADSGAEDAVEHGAGPGELTGFRNGEADGVVKKFRYPVRDAAHGEGQHGKPERGGQEGGIAEKSGDGGAIGCCFDVVFSTTRGLTSEDAIKRCDDQPGNGADEEGLTPAPQRSHLATGHVAKCGADRNRSVEDGQNSVAVAFRVEVGDDGGGEDAEGRLANADDGVAEVERPVAVHPGGGEGGQAPEHCAGDDEGLATIAVAEPAGQRRRQHVNEKHGRGERAHLLAGGVEFTLNEREFAGEDVAIDVVEQVEGDEEDERGESGRDARPGYRGSRQAGPFFCRSC